MSWKGHRKTIRIIDFITLCNQEYETKDFGIKTGFKSQICYLALKELEQATYILEVSESSFIGI